MKLEAGEPEKLQQKIDELVMLEDDEQFDEAVADLMQWVEACQQAAAERKLKCGNA